MVLGIPSAVFIGRAASRTAVVNQATVRVLALTGFHPHVSGSGLRAPLAE